MANRYWVGDDGDFDSSSTANWSNSSGGAPGASVPTTGDKIIFDANSFSADGKNVNINSSISGTFTDIDFSGINKEVTFTATGTDPDIRFSGSIKGSAKISFITDPSTNKSFRFLMQPADNTSVTIQSNGMIFKNGIVIAGPVTHPNVQTNSTKPVVTLLDDLVIGESVAVSYTNKLSGIILIQGDVVFDANDFNITAPSLQFWVGTNGLGTYYPNIYLKSGTFTVIPTHTKLTSFLLSNVLFLGAPVIDFGTSLLLFDLSVLPPGSSTQFWSGNTTFNLYNMQVDGNNDGHTFIFNSSNLTFNEFRPSNSPITFEFSLLRTYSFSFLDLNGTVDNLITITTSSLVLGVVNTLSILNGGLGYTQDDTISIIGEGFGANCNVDSVDENGRVTSLSIVGRGSGYEDGPHNTFSNIIGNILSGDIVNGGSGYEVDDIILVSPNIDDVDATDGHFRVLTIGPGGVVTSIALEPSDPGYQYRSGVHNTEPTESREGKIISATISNGGLGYTAGDYVYVEASGGDPDATDGYFLIDSVDGNGAITGISLDSEGEGYMDGIHSVTPLDFGGSGATLNLTVQHDGVGLTVDIEVNPWELLTVNITAVNVGAYFEAENTSITYLDVENIFALGNIPFLDYPGGVDSGNNTNWIFGPDGRLPNYNPSIITAVKKVQQNLAFPQFIMAGKGGVDEDEFALFKKSTTYGFCVWRSKVYQIGNDFDVMEITMNLLKDLSDSVLVLPVLYFDNETINSPGNIINSTNYSNDDKFIGLTSKNFNNKVHGKDNFFLELQFWGTDLMPISLPIFIDLEINE